jgi:hypothetical protein
LYGNKAKIEVFIPIPNKILGKLKIFLTSNDINGLILPPSKLLKRKKIKLHGLSRIERIEIIVTNKLRGYTRKIRDMSDNEITKKFKIKDIKTFKDRWRVISMKISMHKLRHGYAVYYTENDGSSRVLQSNLGHKHSISTDRYTHVEKTKQVEETNRVFG